MSTIEARVGEELCRLQKRTRRALGMTLAALLVLLAGLAPLTWLVTQNLMLVPISSTSFLPRALTGEVQLQQAVRAGTGEFRCFFTVTARDGTLVRSLDRSALEVFTDEVGLVSAFELNSAAAEPLTIFVALDTSQAMAAGNRLGLAREALERWVKTVAPRQMALIAFNNNPRLELPPSPDAAQFSRALGQLSPSGQTALYDAVVFAAERAFDVEGRKLLLVFSDGDDSASKLRLSDATSRARQAALPVFAVALGSPAGRAGLEKLAHDTGGRTFAATEPAAMSGALSDLADLLQSQFQVRIASHLPRPNSELLPAGLATLVSAILLALYVVFRRWFLAPRLVILGGPKHGLAIPITSEILVCGSDPGCHVQVPGDLRTTAGRRFAIERRGASISFHRLDPSGATTINRAAIETRDLVSGDVIRAGLARFLFYRYDSRKDWAADLGSLVGQPSARLKDPFWLISEEGGPAFHIDGERVRVGREPDNNVVIEDPSVSRRHAEFVRTPEGWMLADLGSRNGTYLSASRLAAEAPVFEGMRVRFGRIKCSLSVMAPGDEFGDIESIVNDPEPETAAEPRPVAPPPAPPIAVQPVAPPPAPAAAPESGPVAEFSAAAAEAVAAAQAAQSPAAPAEPPPSQAIPIASQEDRPGQERACPLCAHSNRPGARYCTQCGDKLEAGGPA